MPQKFTFILFQIIFATAIFHSSLAFDELRFEELENELAFKDEKKYEQIIGRLCTMWDATSCPFFDEAHKTWAEGHEPDAEADSFASNGFTIRRLPVFYVEADGTRHHDPLQWTLKDINTGLKVFKSKISPVLEAYQGCCVSLQRAADSQQTSLVFHIKTESYPLGDLRQFMSDPKNRSLISFLPWKMLMVGQLLAAVELMQRADYMHRDIKLENLKLRTPLSLTLTDYSFSRKLIKKAPQTALKAQTMLGTPFYAAPEIMEQRAYSFEAEIYSLGVAVFEIMNRLNYEIDANGHKTMLEFCNGFNAELEPENAAAFEKYFYCRNFNRMVLSMINKKAEERPNIYNVIVFVINTYEEQLPETLEDSKSWSVQNMYHVLGLSQKDFTAALRENFGKQSLDNYRQLLEQFHTKKIQI